MRPREVNSKPDLMARTEGQVRVTSPPPRGGCPRFVICASGRAGVSKVQRKRKSGQTHPQLDALLVEEHGEVRQPARPDHIHARVPPIRRDAPQRQTEILLPKWRDRQQRFEEPPYASFERTLVGDLAVLDRAGVEEDACAGIADLDPRTLGEFLHQAEEGDLVDSQAGVVVVWPDPVYPYWSAREEGEDEAVPESGVACEVEYARGRGWSVGG